MLFLLPGLNTWVLVRLSDDSCTCPYLIHPLQGKFWVTVSFHCAGWHQDKLFAVRHLPFSQLVPKYLVFPIPPLTQIFIYFSYLLVFLFTCLFPTNSAAFSSKAEHGQITFL